MLGPQWEIDEAGLQYIGMVIISPLPILNNGTPLVKQREAEHRRAHVALEQVQQRAESQVRAGSPNGTAPANWSTTRPD